MNPHLANQNAVDAFLSLKLKIHHGLKSTNGFDFILTAQRKRFGDEMMSAYFRDIRDIIRDECRR